MSMMSDLPAYVAFAAVVEEGSLAGAARRLNSSKAAISRYIARLEALAGVKLVNRTSRTLSLTASGAELYQSCGDMLRTAIELDQMTRGLAASPRGVLRLFAPPVLQASNFPMLIARFVSDHPDISIDFKTGNLAPDPARVPFDAYFFIGNTALPELHQIELAKYRSVVCASREYLERRGVPMKVEQLTSHDCIVQTQRPRSNIWIFKLNREVQVKGRLDSDNAWSALAAVRQGLGLARLPIFVVAEHLKSGELVSVLDDFMPEGQRFVVAYRPVKRIPGKLRVFLDFARREFKADNVLWHEF
jgi:DNA-binding transcriptional LysR family regulator